MPGSVCFGKYGIWLRLNGVARNPAFGRYFCLWPSSAGNIINITYTVIVGIDGCMQLVLHIEFPYYRCDPKLIFRFLGIDRHAIAKRGLSSILQYCLKILI